MRAREGDMVKARGAFFDVRGFLHPPGKLVASLHFLRDARGDRGKGGVRYSRVPSFSECQRLLKRNFPRYLTFDPVFGEHLCEVPVRDIDCLYRPTDRLRELRNKNRLDEVEKQALSFLEILKESSNVPWRNLGISGSILVKLHSSTSDMDPVIYGSKNCRKVYVALRSQIENKQGPIKPHDMNGLRQLHKFRSRDTIVSFKDSVKTEARKVLQGRFSGGDYSIKLIKDWDEVGEKYGSSKYSPVGCAKIRAEVIDDLEGIFTPCRYVIEKVKIMEGPQVRPLREIVSFRMRFCEQARCGEKVIAEGKVERVSGKKGEETYRLMVGNESSDFIIRN